MPLNPAINKNKIKIAVMIEVGRSDCAHSACFADAVGMGGCERARSRTKKNGHGIVLVHQRQIEFPIMIEVAAHHGTSRTGLNGYQGRLESTVSLSKENANTRSTSESAGDRQVQFAVIVEIASDDRTMA
jgi:hypothetical protein